MSRLPKLPMVQPCNHIRKDDRNHYGCAVLGECVPITQGPDLSACPSFAPNGVKRVPAAKRRTPGLPFDPAKIPNLEEWAEKGTQEIERHRKQHPMKSLCAHLGLPTGELALCHTCRGRVQLKLFACEVHGNCTMAKPVEQGIACCAKCGDYAPRS